jgi:Uma2 family endonuclease
MSDKQDKGLDMTYQVDASEPMMVCEASSEYRVQRVYTYDEVQSWFTETKRFEMIDGAPYAMAGASPRHQEIKDKLSRRFGNYLEGKSCRAFTETEVRFDVDKNDTFFIPDLLILCDRNKLGPRGVNGAPELIVEILSPSTSRHDRFVKRHKYQQAGVKEYWMIDPENELLEVALLSKDGIYRSITYGEDVLVEVNILESFEIDLSELFADSWVD